MLPLDGSRDPAQEWTPQSYLKFREVTQEPLNTVALRFGLRLDPRQMRSYQNDYGLTFWGRSVCALLVVACVPILVWSFKADAPWVEFGKHIPGLYLSKSSPFEPGLALALFMLAVNLLLIAFFVWCFWSVSQFFFKLSVVDVIKHYQVQANSSRKVELLVRPGSVAFSLDRRRASKTWLCQSVIRRRVLLVDDDLEDDEGYVDELVLLKPAVGPSLIVFGGEEKSSADLVAAKLSQVLELPMEDETLLYPARSA